MTHVRISIGTSQLVDHVSVIHLVLGTMWAHVWSSQEHVSAKIMWRVTVVIHVQRDTFRCAVESKKLIDLPIVISVVRYLLMTYDILD